MKAPQLTNDISAGWNRLARYQCACGASFETRARYVEGGNTRSCGCLKRRLAVRLGRALGLKYGPNRRVHGHNQRGETSPTYRSWANMRQRCINPGNNRWKYYGGRGICFSPMWWKFENFLADMGKRPDGTTLERIDNNGDYCRSNCRWATPKEQAANRRHHNED